MGQSVRQYVRKICVRQSSQVFVESFDQTIECFERHGFAFVATPFEDQSPVLSFHFVGEAADQSSLSGAGSSMYMYSDNGTRRGRLEST
jgi:hypothetical protein